MTACIACTELPAAIAGLCESCLTLPKHEVYATTQQGLNAACHKPPPLPRTFSFWKPVETIYVPNHGGQVCILWMCGIVADATPAAPPQESWTKRWLCECGNIVPGYRVECDCGRGNPARHAETNT